MSGRERRALAGACSASRCWRRMRSSAGDARGRPGARVARDPRRRRARRPAQTAPRPRPRPRRRRRDCPGRPSSATSNGTRRGMPSKRCRTPTRRAPRSATSALASRSREATRPARCPCSTASRRRCRCSPTTWRVAAPRRCSSSGPSRRRASGSRCACRRPHRSSTPRAPSRRPATRGALARRPTAWSRARRRTRDEEAEARALRVRLTDPPGDAERADARWLATLGADLPAAADALALVAKLDPKHPLTSEELLSRARVLSDAGRVDDALRVDRPLGGRARRRQAHQPESRARARAWRSTTRAGTRARRRRSSPSARAPAGRKGAEDAFHAARALSRADRDEEAIRGYEDVQRRFPKTQWAEQAAFFVPYLRMLHGEWTDCARGFDAYLAAHSRRRGRARRRARRRALQAPRRRDQGVARVAFEQLVEDEPDPIASARMADMAALAALRDGDRTHAVARWTDVARSRPLSWPALVARARLAEAGAAVPPAIDPGGGPRRAPTRPLSVVVSRRRPTCCIGSGSRSTPRARSAIARARSRWAPGGRAPEALCTAYGELGRARRRYQIAQSLPSALFVAAPGPRTRWAWECAFPSPYAEDVRAAEAAENLPSGLLWAVMRQESGFDPGRRLARARRRPDAAPARDGAPGRRRARRSRTTTRASRARPTPSASAPASCASCSTSSTANVAARRRRLQRRRRLGRAMGLARAGDAARHASSSASRSRRRATTSRA